MNKAETPDKLKILTADMISAYIRVNENRKKLISDLDQQKLTTDQAFKLAQTTVLFYQVNELAFNELSHYQQKGEILGRHSIFDEDNLKIEIDSMSDVEAYKLYKNLASQVSRLRKKVEKAPLDMDFKRQLEFKQNKRELLHRKLNAKQIL